MRRQRGIALVLVLWMVVLLAVIAGALGTTSRSGVAMITNLRQEHQARALVEAGLQFMMLQLTWRNLPVEDNPWPADGRLHPWTFAGQRIWIGAQPENARLGLNAVDEKQLGRLLHALGLPDEQAEALRDAILDWRDADDGRRPQGAEDDDYRAAGRPLTTKPANARSAAAYTASGPNQNLLVSWSRVFRDVVQGQDPRVALHDARPEAEFKGDKIRAIRGGHIPGAINLTGVDAANHKNEQTFKPIDEIRAAFVKAGITPDKTVYTYCHSSDRAAHAYMVLKHLLGYPDVKVYEGAWKEWGNLTALPAANETLP